MTAGGAVPPGWSDAPVVTIDDAALADPEAAVTALHEAWAGRRPVVVALAVDPARFRAPVAHEVDEPWLLAPDLELWFDRLHFLVWANTYDARSGVPIWWWGRKAARLGATEVAAGQGSGRVAAQPSMGGEAGGSEAGGEAGDVVLPDGSPAWVDGGPRGDLGPDDVGATLVHAESVEAGLLTPVPPRVSTDADAEAGVLWRVPAPMTGDAGGDAGADADAGGDGLTATERHTPAAAGQAGTGRKGDRVEGGGRGTARDGGRRTASGNDPGADEGWNEWVSSWEGVAVEGPDGAPSRDGPARSPLVDLAPDPVTHGAGPARVIAPAGSGKTRVLTARLRHLLVDRAYEPGSVVAVAYNRKARDEMAERLGPVGARILTLNALGYELVRAGLGRRPEVIEQREVRRLLEPLVPRMTRRLNTDPLAPYIDALGTVRLGLRDPVEVEEERGDVPGLAEAFPAYRAELRSRGVIDFDEQVLLAIELLLHDGEFRRAQQARHRHLLVDEFQDLTPAHVLLVRLLAAPRFDVFGVGDDDQVIYGHAGASPRFLTAYDHYFPGATPHALEVNYRCPGPVVDAVRNLLTHNRARVPKRIGVPGEVTASSRAAAPENGAGEGAAGEGEAGETGAGEGPADVLRLVLHPPQVGASRLVGTVEGWLGEPGLRPTDVAVLARVGSLLLAPHVALVEAGLPVASSLGPDVLRRTGVRAALAYLRIASSPEHFAGADLVEVRRRPSRGMPNWVDKWLGRCRSVHDVAVASERIDDVKVSDKLADMAADLAELGRRAQSGTTREVLEYVLDGVGLGRAVELLDASGGGDGHSHRDDLEALIQVADLHPDPGGFEPWLRDVLARPDDPGGVTLSTVHRVKGREWPRVAVFGATEGLVPHRLAEGRAAVEEERRVFHVAITRAIDRVVVLGDVTRASPFLDELAREATEADLARADRLDGEGGDSAGGAAGRSRGARRIPGGRQDELAARRARRRERMSGDEGGTAAGGPSVTGSSATGDPALTEALRAWRRERSRADGVPAYVVFPDKCLTAIAERHPTTLDALARCPGIGPARLEAYGDDLLELLRSHEPASP